MARVKNAWVKAAGGSFPVRVLLPAEKPRGVIVYYHRSRTSPPAASR